MTFTAHGDGLFDLDGRWTRCALGPRGRDRGQRQARGGRWNPSRRLADLAGVLYRPDRRAPPVTAFPVQALEVDDGWCDAQNDPAYNRQVKLPYPASAEHLWREDGIYDLIVILDYNDDPVVPGMGSAIFLHLARPEFTETQGCVALASDDLEAVLAAAKPGDALVVETG